MSVGVSTVCNCKGYQAGQIAAAQIPPQVLAAVGSGISKPEDPSEQEAKRTSRLQTFKETFSSLCLDFYI